MFLLLNRWYGFLPFDSMNSLQRRKGMAGKKRYDMAIKKEGIVCVFVLSASSSISFGIKCHDVGLV